MSSLPYIETFSSLSQLDGLVHGFILKHPDIDVKTDRETAIRRLEEHHVAQLNELGISRSHLATGLQVHGNHVEVCSPDNGPVNTRYPETDGLVTATAGQYIGVFVADCGAVFIADPVKRVCGLVHSGKKGTEMAIAPVAIETMMDTFGSDPEDIVVQLGPCIRPPEYEIDFASHIVENCVSAGVPESQVFDCGVCTTSDPDRYYSYRKEKGKTGRLFAVIGWRE